ncbi:MAG: hypothetical protein KGL15_05890 [Acidobacteriota bacterium]|nr:hypothetical protein [Acidobacteriota bacterium]
MKRTVILVMATAALALPGSALAAPQLVAPIPSAKPTPAGTGGTVAQLPLNYASDRRALNAYASYLTTLLNAAPTGNTNDTTYISTISSQCKGALAPLTQPSQQVNYEVQHTLTVLGEEMGDDLAINFEQSAVAGFAKFTTALARLHWSRYSGWYGAIRRYVNTQNNVLALSPSSLCADAAYAELRPAIVPDGTKTFIKAYNDSSKAASAALTNLTKLMETYEAPSEKSLISRISSLVSQVSALTKSDLLQNGSALATVLEST